MTILPIIYHSKSGNTRSLALQFEARLKDMLPGRFTVTLVDAATIDDHRQFLDAPAFVIGSPDYFSHVSGRVKNFFDDTWGDRDRLRGKPVACVVSHGGGGKAAKPLEGMCKSLGLRLVKPVISSRGTGDERTARAIEDACKALAAALA